MRSLQRGGDDANYTAGKMESPGEKENQQSRQLSSAGAATLFNQR